MKTNNKDQEKVPMQHRCPHEVRMNCYINAICPYNYNRRVCQEDPVIGYSRADYR